MSEDILDTINNFDEYPQGPLPNAQTAFILGILSIFPGCFCCLGFIFGIVGLIMSNNAITTYNANPQSYFETDFKKAKNGRTMSIIGLVLTILGIVLQVFMNIGAVLLEGNSF